jgi:SAM-dependent methyltransferase
MSERQLDATLTTEVWNQADLQRMRDVSWGAIRFLWDRSILDGFGTLDLVGYIHTLLKTRNGGRVDGYSGATLLCGDMTGERMFFETDQIIRFSDVDAFDISPVLLNQYRPASINFHPHVLDCNEVILEREKYDLIVILHGAHHVYNLGNLFYQCNKALKPNGLIHIYEWIGPRYLQIPRMNHAIATFFLYTMFSRLVRTTHMGIVKGRWVQYPPDAFEPSEACNAPELMPQFLHYFRPLNVNYFNGLIYPIFEGIGFRFNQRHRLTMLKVKAIYQAERLLTRIGLVKPLFAVALAEKRMIS